MPNQVLQRYAHLHIKIPSWTLHSTPSHLCLDNPLSSMVTTVSIIVPRQIQFLICTITLLASGLVQGIPKKISLTSCMLLTPMAPQSPWMMHRNLTSTEAIFLDQSRRPLHRKREKETTNKGPKLELETKEPKKNQGQTTPYTSDMLQAPLDDLVHYTYNRFPTPLA